MALLHEAKSIEEAHGDMVHMVRNRMGLVVSHFDIINDPLDEDYLIASRSGISRELCFIAGCFVVSIQSLGENRDIKGVDIYGPQLAALLKVDIYNQKSWKDWMNGFESIRI